MNRLDPSVTSLGLEGTNLCMASGDPQKFCCVTVSSDIETFYPRGKLLGQEGKQLKIASRKSLKKIEFTRPLPVIVNNKNYEEPDKPGCREDSETRPAASEQRKPTKLPGKGLDGSHLKRTLSNPVNCQQVQCLQVSQLV